MKKSLSVLFCLVVALAFAGDVKAHYHGGRALNVGRTAFAGYGASYGCVPSQIVQAPAIITYVAPAPTIVTQTTTTYSSSATTGYAAPAATGGVITTDPAPTLSTQTQAYLWSLTPSQAFGYLSTNYGRFARTLFRTHFGNFANGRPVFNSNFRTAFGNRASGGVILNNGGIGNGRGFQGGFRGERIGTRAAIAATRTFQLQRAFQADRAAGRRGR